MAGETELNLPAGAQAHRVTGRTRRQAAGEEPARTYIPLFWRLFVPNATVLGAACIVLVVEPANGRIVALAGGLLTMLVVNVVLMRRAFAPLARLTQLMANVDPLRPGRRISVPGPASEVTVLAETFNAMLDRLEIERRDSGRRTLAAQEDERRHLAAELHDEMGQTVTAMILQLSRIAAGTTGTVHDDAVDARDTASELVEEIRALARRLRPEALDALGLPAALANLTERLSQRTGLAIERRIDHELPPLSAEAELVIFRVAQEALTNVVRHAEATRATVTLGPDPDGVVLRVEDDGRGLPRGPIAEGGIRNMRERALLVGGDLSVGPRDGAARGTTVRLHVGWEERISDDARTPAPR